MDASEAQSVLCLSVLERAAHAHTHTHTHALQPEEQRLSCGLYFKHFIIKHVQQFSNCKDGILQQSIDLILTLSFGQGGTNARRCEEKEVVLDRRNSAIILKSQNKNPLNKLSLI